MQEERIRLAKTNSVTSDNKESFVDIDLKQHSRLFPFDDVIDTIDQMQQFEKERKECNKYRLILTINPYCTNILFNAVSEIVQNEGTDKPNDLVIANKQPITPDSGNYEIKGKSRGVTNYDMVRNTEYCNCDSPFVYHCGYDIFNNHILRNMTFKPVNDYSGSKVSDFNTISDYMRNASGKNIKLSKRIIENEKIKIKEEKKRHLYLKEDILNYTDSINVNLYEKNGWWGFSNTSNITTKYINATTEMPISRVFNNEDLMGCGFVEMYPDSSLYSFSPKYNSLQNREEYNWDICITYPYECEYKKDLVNGETENGNVNAMLIAETTLATGTSGQSIILFRTFVKHNLNVGDYVRLFYKKNTDTYYEEIQGRRFRVVNIGNLKSEYQDYYFYINDAQYIIEKLEAENDANVINNTTFRFIKVVNDIDCKYYYRKFKKLPNFKFKEKELTDEVAQDNGKLNEYIDSNCKTKDGKLALFNKEQYPLAFSNTIYNDGKTQVVFTDSIDIDKLTDNLGRPLTELYVTIIKRNKGYDTWYNVTKTADDLKNIEFSHCFGRVDSGLKIHGEYKDSNIINSLRENVNDVCLIKRKKEKDNQNLDNNITIDDDEFYGDVVELNQETLNETVLSDVCFRFNTAQREYDFKTAIDGEKITFDFSYDEIKTDDYDYAGFECEKKVLFDNTENNNIRRDEGYYYKAHYPFKVRRFGTLRQGSHQTIPVETCNIRQSHGLIIEVVSSIRSGVTHGSVVYLCEVDTNKKIAEFTVNNIQNQVRFAINYPPTYYIDNVTPNIYDIVNGLRYREEKLFKYDIWTDEDGIEHFVTEDTETVNNYANPRYKLLLRNVDIPFYAREIDNSNVYLWRDITNDTVVEDGKEIEYPFANGHIYINKEINFFLKRQDPFGYNGLYSQDKNPIDIIGNMRKENNYEYKDETNIVC